MSREVKRVWLSANCNITECLVVGMSYDTQRIENEMTKIFRNNVCNNNILNKAENIFQ